MVQCHFIQFLNYKFLFYKHEIKNGKYLRKIHKEYTFEYNPYGKMGPERIWIWVDEFGSVKFIRRWW
jgi:hypothetical protein